MRFSVWPSPTQTWDTTLSLATHAEESGWDGVWVADHFMPNGEDPSGVTLECWATVAALVVAVPRIRIGTLVCGNTYRHPAVLANQAATVDVISGGRLTLGVGAGWQRNEHERYGIDLHTTRGRLERLDEACQVIKSLTTQERTSFTGDHYRLEDAPLEPKPVQDPLPLLVGGGGEKVTLRIAAEHADAWNTWGDPSVLAHKIEVLEQHCDDVGRDPATIQKSAQALVFLSDDRSEIDHLRDNVPGNRSIIGTPEELTETLGAYRDAGVEEFVVPDFNLGTGPERTEVYDRFLEEVAAPLR
ncbi:MAG: TIGR03560 family F420-dependent LLM class oxidoreductase [Actinobacteria bacterium]|nr:TIGR03560 family F420-dependent LLM class oxidoreductase [Actinomycetota bacterium]